MKGATLALAALLAVTAASADKKVVCYWGSWSTYRVGDGKFETSNIDPTLCTHMIYSFVGLTDDGEVRILDAWNDLADGGGKNNIQKFNDLRQQSPGTKTMVAIGGWNEGSTRFSRITANPSLRSKLVTSIVNFVKKYGFDGFDVDWEYPAQREGSSPADKQNYIEFLKELKARFSQEGLILSAAVAAAESSASQSYNIPEMSKHLDFINLMAYDLHGVWEGKTGMNAGLYPREAGDKLNVDSAVQYWLSQGAPADKLVLGVPLYGRGYTLNNPSSNQVGAPANSAASPGPYTKEPGMLGYNEICEKLNNEHWDVHYDDVQKVPYAVNGNQWVSFDNEKSLKEKTDYVKKYGLAGAMVWSIETDDFLGKCGEKYPLLKTLNRELRNGAAPEAPQQSQPQFMPQPAPEKQKLQQFEPQQPQWQEPQQPQWQEPQQPQQPQSNGQICQNEGYVRDPNQCGNFYYCQAYNGEFISHPFQCPESLVFDPSTSVCNYPTVVQC